MERVRENKSNLFPCQCILVSNSLLLRALSNSFKCLNHKVFHHSSAEPYRASFPRCSPLSLSRAMPSKICDPLGIVSCCISLCLRGCKHQAEKGFACFPVITLAQTPTFDLKGSGRQLSRSQALKLLGESGILQSSYKGICESSPANPSDLIPILAAPPSVPSNILQAINSDENELRYSRHGLLEGEQLTFCS